MENKIDAFNLYLDTLRKDASEKFKEKSKKLSYKELVKNKILAETEIDEAVLKKMTFKIKQVEIDKFEIQGRAGSINMGDSIKIDLEDLLVAKESQEHTMEIGAGLTVNVKPTIVYLNEHFFAK